jgi:hypothetical protein
MKWVNLGRKYTMYMYERLSKAAVTDVMRVLLERSITDILLVRYFMGLVRVYKTQ